MRETMPLTSYVAIKTRDNKIVFDVIRTRESWHKIYTGTWVEYDSQVKDVLCRYVCPACGKVNLLWNSQFEESNGFLIYCDSCLESILIEDRRDDGNVRSNV